MSTETESGLPSQAPGAEQGAQQVEQHTSTEATAGQPQQEGQQQAQQEDQHQEPKRTPWFQTRIDELTRARHEERRRADEAQQESLRYRQQLAALQQGHQPDQQQPQTQGQEVDVRTLAQQEAARMVADQRFNEQCNRIYDRGSKEFSDFPAAVANLQMLGVSRDFLELATSSDAGAKLLHHLGTDLDETARLLTLPPVQQARELTRLEFKLAQAPAPKPVSKAPAPITPLGSSATTDADPSRMSDSEWFAHRQKTRK
jgi:hypothetical protein